VGGLHAPVRILLQRLQENLFEDFDHCRAWRGKDHLPALQQQERRAALVRVFRHHLEEERLTTLSKEAPMHFDNFSFGSIQIDGSTYEHDVVIDRREISKRKNKASKQFRAEFGHTPLSVEENIPWKCRQLVIGTGAYGRLPVMQEVRREAERLKIKLLVLPTAEAIKVLEQDLKDTNAIIHVTC
jgi:hypothetical protein